MLLIGVDSPGCHYFAVEVSERRYNRPKYMEALYNSIEMVFKKLKYHKGKMDITITEVDDYDATEYNKGQKQKRAKAILENDEAGEQTPLESEGVPTYHNAYKPGDKTV